MQQQQTLITTKTGILRNTLLGFLALLVWANPASGQDKKVDGMCMIEEHNAWRAQVGSPGLRWSKNLARQAAKWAAVLKKDGCALRHSRSKGVGENLYWASAKKTATRKDSFGRWIWKNSPQQVTEKDVVASWGSEKKWYSHRNNSCNAPDGAGCGHYTQMVWKTTTEVGCAAAICEDQSQIWVCNYAPAGNVVGRKPY
ncbi:CAP domain-containing protein [Thiovibrio sp. JS02]